MADKERPLGVSILGILSLLFGLISVIAGRQLVTLGPSYLGWIGQAAGAILIGLGITEGVFGLGCFMGWPRAWLLGVILLSMGILFQIFRLLTWIISVGFVIAYPEVEEGMGVVIDGFLVFYLYRPHVKAYFERA